MAKIRKTQEEIDREQRAKERIAKLQADADARRDQRAKRASETVQEQRDRLAKERAERDKNRQERAARARTERARIQAERENRRTAVTDRVKAERERERLARQAEADKRKWEADNERNRRRFVTAGWSPTLIDAIEGKGEFVATMRGGTEVDFSEAKEASSPSWVTLISDEGNIEARLADILLVKGRQTEKHKQVPTKAQLALAEAEGGAPASSKPTALDNVGEDLAQAGAAAATVEYVNHANLDSGKPE